MIDENQNWEDRKSTTRKNNNLIPESYKDEIYPDSMDFDIGILSEYDFNDLYEFFMNTHEYAADDDLPFVSIDDVNETFPIEFIRINAEGEHLPYSIFRADNGIYYYVKWIKYQNLDPNTLYVSSFFYLPSGVSEDDFDSIEVGRSTLQDVKKIDLQYKHIAFISSHSTVYSYISKERIIQIDCSNDFDKVVEKKAIISRDDNVFFGGILDKDLVL